MTNPTIIEGETTYTTPDFDGLDALFRLMIGISLEGFDQFFSRLKKLETELYDPTYFTADSTETPVDQLRYLMLGLSYMGQRRVRLRMQQVNRVAGALGGLMRPLRARVQSNALVKIGAGMISAEVERIIGEGRLQEQNARQMVRHIFGSSINEVVDYLSDNQNMSRLVNQQMQSLSKSETLTKLSDQLLEQFAAKTRSTGFNAEDDETLDAIAEAILNRLQRP